MRNQDNCINDMAKIIKNMESNKLPVPIRIVDSIFWNYIVSDSRKGPTMHLHVPVSVEELYNGTVVKAMFETKQACSKCQGTGADSLKSLRECPSCKGKGFSMIQGRNMHGQPQQFEGVCPQCHGTGRVVTKQCPICRG